MQLPGFEPRSCQVNVRRATSIAESITTGKLANIIACELVKIIVSPFQLYRPIPWQHSSHIGTLPRVTIACGSGKMNMVSKTFYLSSCIEGHAARGSLSSGSVDGEPTSIHYAVGDRTSSPRLMSLAPRFKGPMADDLSPMRVMWKLRGGRHGLCLLVEGHSPWLHDLRHSFQWSCQQRPRLRAFK